MQTYIPDTLPDGTVSQRPGGQCTTCSGNHYAAECPSKPYDPDLDPKRTDERTVRRMVPDTIRGAKVVAQGRFTRGGEGCYAAVEVVMLWPADEVLDDDRAYSTNTLVLRVERTGEGEHYLISGRYDLSYPVAMADLATR